MSNEVDREGNEELAQGNEVKAAMRRTRNRGTALCMTLAIIVISIPADAEVQYAGSPNHRELATAALQLAIAAGFKEPHVQLVDVQARLESGAFCEDFDPIPGMIGVYFPDPWDRFPQLTLGDLLSVMKIPSGNLVDPLSGWARGLPHGFDPLKGFRWPGTSMTTVQWANSSTNTFTWDKAIQLYQEGNHVEAYECLGHLIHLLTDLSIPSHVKVVDHGVHLSVRHNGYLIDPDVAAVIIDEYESALQGGLEINGVTDAIPDLLGVFRSALSRARVDDIPAFSHWSDFFNNLATYTATLPLVTKYYAGPDADGTSGHCRDVSGMTVLPTQLGTISPPVKIGDRWTQFGVFSTAKIPGGTILPAADMQVLCDSLVPRAVESAAALILKFQEAVQTSTGAGIEATRPKRFFLDQNYPNPFNPSTMIKYALPKSADVKLRVYDILGRAVTVLVDETKEAGVHEVRFDASNLASGVYVYQLEAADVVLSKRLIVLR